MDRLKVGIVFGGCSEEHPISVKSAQEIAQHLDVEKLAPSDHMEDQFKAILGGCTTVVNGLGSHPQRASDAHGQGRRSYRPASRHAALAVNLAGSMALFLMETHEARQTA